MVAGGNGCRGGGDGREGNGMYYRPPRGASETFSFIVKSCFDAANSYTTICLLLALNALKPVRQKGVKDLTLQTSCWKGANIASVHVHNDRCQENTGQG